MEGHCLLKIDFSDFSRNKRISCLSPSTSFEIIKQINAYQKTINIMLVFRFYNNQKHFDVLSIILIVMNKCFLINPEKKKNWHRFVLS